MFDVEPYYPGQTGTYQSVVRISRNALGVNDKTQPDQVMVYPNPVTDYLFIESADQRAVLSGIKLFSVTGCELTTVNFTGLKSGCSMSVTNLQDGTYILAVTTVSGIIHRQIVIRKK